MEHVGGGQEPLVEDVADFVRGQPGRGWEGAWEQAEPHSGMEC